MKLPARPSSAQHGPRRLARRTGLNWTGLDWTRRVARGWNAYLAARSATREEENGAPYGRDQLREVGLASPGHETNVEGVPLVAEHQLKVWVNSTWTTTSSAAAAAAASSSAAGS